MMMIGRQNATVQIPQWEDPTATIAYLTGAHSPPEFSPSAYAAALSAYEFDSDESDPLPFDSFACDEFRMYEFKIRRCVRGRSHDWTDCPFAHPGEKARRRDPRRHHYAGAPCPEFRKGSCRKGDSCEFAHGVFECWLHPSRYRTQPCKDGTHCTRRVCFFAHSPEQLRILPDSDSTRSESAVDSVSELVGSLRGLQIGLSPRSCTWGVQLSGSARAGSGLGSTTPKRIGGAPNRLFDAWNLPVEEEPPMERVESGKNLRAAMYAKLRRDNSMDRAEPVNSGPDFGWISELVK